MSRAVLLLAGILGWADASLAAATPAMGEYRAVLSAQGKTVVGYLLNGKERVPLNEVSIQGSHLEIRMPGYENRLSADASGNELTGEVVLSKSGGKQQHLTALQVFLRHGGGRRCGGTLGGELRRR